MNDRDCQNCINGSVTGCVSWDCNFISRKEAREAVKLMRERGRDCKECIVRKLDEMDAIAGQMEGPSACNSFTVKIVADEEASDE